MRPLSKPGYGASHVILFYGEMSSIQSVHEQHPMSPGDSPLDYYSDPRNIGRHVADSFARQGMEVPRSVRETIEAARQGEMPKGLDT